MPAATRPGCAVMSDRKTTIEDECEPIKRRPTRSDSHMRNKILLTSSPLAVLHFYYLSLGRHVINHCKEQVVPGHCQPRVVRNTCHHRRSSLSER